jgi:hypothetical protein
MQFTIYNKIAQKAIAVALRAASCVLFYDFMAFYGVSQQWEFKYSKTPHKNWEKIILK